MTKHLPENVALQGKQKNTTKTTIFKKDTPGSVEKTDPPDTERTTG